MLLDNIAHFNELTDEMRSNLEEKIKSYGKVVRYKFDIAKPNPDPQKYNGENIYPKMYTLDPCIFSIIDDKDKRPGKRSKKIALIDQTDEKNIPNRFRKIRVDGGDKGLYTLNILSNQDHFQYAMYLELHPKNRNGMFPDANAHQVFARIDELAYATTQRTERTLKLKALNIAQGMSDAEVVSFADGMVWDSTDEMGLLRNKVEDLAETNPEFFTEVANGKSMEYRAAVKRGLDKQIIGFDPAEYKFIWTNNKQPIVLLQQVDGKSHVEQMADWIERDGDKGSKFYEKLKGLIKV